ncbi:MAG: WcaI family glycosyltransferase [Geobacter sp.]|nr:WcaI family glycosyltransferase [Geobacter sp.]
MKILLYGINYYPELTGIGKYSGELCEWLAAQGHDISVVTAPPYYPAWKISSEYSTVFYFRESVNGVDVFRCPLWIPKLQSGKNRILHLLSFTFSSAPLTLLLALLWRPDCIITVEPPFFCAFPALIAARMSGSAAWLHVQDLEIDAAVNVELIKPSRTLNMLLSFESWLLSKFDRVSSISNRMIESLKIKGVSDSQSILFPNWVDTSILKPLDKPSMMRLELGINENCVVALYSGNMGKKQGLELVIDAARVLSCDPSILFVLCGDGSIRRELEESSVGMDNIKMLPLQPGRRLNELLNVADIHILPQQANMDDSVMPSKLLGMLATGRPVVCCALEGKELSKIIKQCGILVPPGNATLFAEAVTRLAKNPEERNLLGEIGRKLCSSAWEKEAVLSSFLKNLGELNNLHKQS